MSFELFWPSRLRACDRKSYFLTDMVVVTSGVTTAEGEGRASAALVSIRMIDAIVGLLVGSCCTQSRATWMLLITSDSRQPLLFPRNNIGSVISKILPSFQSFQACNWKWMNVPSILTLCLNKLQPCPLPNQWHKRIRGVNTYIQKLIMGFSCWTKALKTTDYFQNNDTKAEDIWFYRKLSRCYIFRSHVTPVKWNVFISGVLHLHKKSFISLQDPFQLETENFSLNLFYFGRKIRIETN